MGLSAGCIYYFMSMSALVFTAICIFFSMRIMPEKKLLIFLLAMMPMFLVEITSVSADAVIYGICFLGTAWLISLRKKTTKCSRKEFVGLFALAACLGLLKQVYGVILLLFFILPWKIMGGGRVRFFFVGALLLCVELLISGLWIDMAVYAQGTSIFTGHYLWLEGIDVFEQKAYIMSHPFETLKTIVRSLMHPEIWYAKTFIGILGIVNVWMKEWIYWGYLMLLFAGSICGDLQLQLKHRLIMVVALVIGVIGVFLIEYLIWTPVGGDIIAGVQGRYFIPLAMFFGVLSCKYSMRYENVLAVLGGLFGVGATLWTSYVAFY